MRGRTLLPVRLHRTWLVLSPRIIASLYRLVLSPFLWQFYRGFFSIFVLIVEIVFCSSFSKSRRRTLDYLHVYLNVFILLTVDMVGPPSCLACQSVDVVYPDNIGGLSSRSSPGAPSLGRSVTFGDGFILSRKLLIRNSSSDSDFLSLSVRTFSIFSSALLWLVDVVKVLSKTDFSRFITGFHQGSETLSIIWTDFRTDISRPALTFVSTLSTESFDFGLHFVTTTRELNRISKQVNINNY